jgi:hypothetical protein
MKRIVLVASALVASTVLAQQPLPPANPTSYSVQQDLPSTGTRTRTSSQMDERKFISNGMARATVLGKIGEPDRRIVMRVTIIASQHTFDDPYIDTYEPGPGDEQTRTRIRYVAEAVVSVERDIVR